MKKSFSLRWISLLLAVMMVFSILPLSVFAVDTSTDDTRYTDFLSSLTTLEGYADAYAREHSGEDATALVINYIRCGVEKTHPVRGRPSAVRKTQPLPVMCPSRTQPTEQMPLLCAAWRFSRYPTETKSILRICSVQWTWRTTPVIRVLPTLAAGPAISVICFSSRPMPA